MVDTTAGDVRNFQCLKPPVDLRALGAQDPRLVRPVGRAAGPDDGLQRGVAQSPRDAQARASPSQQQINAQLAFPDPAPATAEAMAAWLQDALKADRPANTLRVERARPVAWSERGGGQRLMQPERWTFNFGGPNQVMQAEYWAGNKSVSVRTTSNGFVATLTNLHKGVGMPIPWILLIDSLAGSLIFLSLSGAILWWETNRRRGLGLTIFGLSVATTVGLALWPMQQ